VSKIEWTEQTWNPVIGCTPVSPGCLNCYAARMSIRLEKMNPKDYGPRDGIRIAEVTNGRPVFTGDVRCLPERLTVPLKRRTPTVYFVNSQSDLFHEKVPDHFIHDVLRVVRQCPQHTFQVLTKRPERAAVFEWRCSKHKDDFSTLPNLWLGTSVEDQKAADERIPHLLRCPAAVRFLSCEPLLGPVDLHGSGLSPLSGGIGWVIVGGESGPQARPTPVAHVTSIVEQCRSAGVPVFVKQMGAKPYLRAECSNLIREWGDTVIQKNGDFVQLHLKDSKGGEPTEWAERLRVREMPNRTD
jgi:protein gp37